MTACKGAEDVSRNMRSFLKGPTPASGSKKTDSKTRSISSSISSSSATTSSTYPKLTCPPYSPQIGRATWTFLHTMAANYPEKPSEETQSDMKTFLRSFSKFYPCGYCAAHLREELQERPPRVQTRQDLGLWMCEIHNEVNNTHHGMIIITKQIIYNSKQTVNKRTLSVV